MSKPWMASVPVNGDRRADVHILPYGDTHPHREARDCWCVPDLHVVEETGTVIAAHHAADGRPIDGEDGPTR